MSEILNRRDFLRLAGLGASAMAFGGRIDKLSIDKPPTGVFGSEIAGSNHGKSLGNIREFFKDYPLVESSRYFRLNCAVIFHLRDLVDEYKAKYPWTVSDEKAETPAPAVLLGDYLGQKFREEGIYVSLKNLSDKRWTGVPRVNFEGAFRLLDYTTYQKGGRPIECIGGVIFLAGLYLPVSPIDLSGVRTSSASGILNDEGRAILRKYHSYTDRKSGLLFKKIEDISEVMVGDIYLLYGGGKDDHVGAVIGRKVIGEETVLLTADANRYNDGRVNVHEVNRLNFKGVFQAERGTPIVVIKNPQVPGSFAVGT